MPFRVLLLMTLPALASDPHQWLEDVTGEKSLAWVKERNAATTKELAQGTAFQTLEKRLLTILDSKEKIPYVTKAGEFYYNLWKDDRNPRGLWRRTTLAEYRKPNPAWETVLDLDALGKAEHENWVWAGGSFLYPTYDRILISLSRGGADAVVVREFDLTSKSFVKDGFTLPEAKSQVAWKDRDTIIVGSDFGPNTLTKSGYPMIAKMWFRGKPLQDAMKFFSGNPDDVEAGAKYDPTPGYERLTAYRALTFYTNESYIHRDRRFQKLDKPDDAEASFHREWLLITLRTDWLKHKAGSLLVIKADDFLSGKRDFAVLFKPTPRTSLAGFTALRNGFIINESDNVCSRLYARQFVDGQWTRERIGGDGIASTSATAIDPRTDDSYFLTTSNYLTPATLMMAADLKAKPEVLKSAPAFFNTKGLVLSQHEATSKDGTKIPYFQVAKQDLKLDGTNPTLLYGYGGFEVSLTPDYSALAGAAWMVPGGVFVVANIRGGGEFGPAWHQAALKENRHRAYEDFAAVAEDLVKRKVTSVKHLGAMGGSNGGLLMGNMLTLYPKHFGAIVCQVPLLDMQRYHTLLAGNSWMAEYGNPDVPKEWESLKTFSPYHNASAAPVPRTLFTTSTRDDRVHPGHARKMVAKLQALGHDVLLYENIEGGHGGAADNKQSAFMKALEYTFLWKQLK